MKRRFFIAGALGLGGLWSLGGLWGCEKKKDAPAKKANAPEQKPSECGTTTLADGRSVLPMAHAQTLRAMCDRIMPEESPTDARLLAQGALTVGAFEYILRELAREEMKSTRRLLMRGAAMLDRQSRSRLGKSFISADSKGQDTVILAMTQGDGATRGFVPQEFVRTMVGLTLEGMFGDPIWGGNRDGEGWQAIGYAMHAPQPSGCH